MLQYAVLIIFRPFLVLHSVSRLPYWRVFGGVSALRTDHFKMINGFSNKFFGWGGEDDDLFSRYVYYSANENM